MSSIFDSMIPSRRREQRRLREEAKRLNERWGDVQISAPNDGCWIGKDLTPELDWSSPLTQGFASPDVASTLVHNSPELGDYEEQVVIVDTDADIVAHTYHEEPEKNVVTFTIPLPWPSRKVHSRSPSANQPTLPSLDTLQRASPQPTTIPAVVYKPTSDQYMRELGDLSRGNSPAQSVVTSARGASQLPALDLPFRQTSPPSSFARRSPSPPVDQEEGHNISAIMLLSPVVEDFPSRPAASSSFSRAGSQRNIAHFTRQVPSPTPERPSTAMSSTSTMARSEVGTTISRATAVTDASFHTAITHHTTRSSSRGPGLAHTGTMRSASREPAPRRAMSREPSERRATSRDPTERRAMSREPVNRRAISRDPTERRAMSREPTNRRAVSREPVSRRAVSREPVNRRAVSREPVNRRAMSREPIRPRAMTGESVIYRTSIEELRCHAGSRSGRTSIESESSDEASASEVGRKVSSSSTAAAAGYYTSMVDEYRNIAWGSSNQSASDSESLVGVVGKLVKEKSKPKEHPPPVPSKDLVPSGKDLYG